jgi:ectoine hydroxylase-related dioxygenase (phytanoyl-CoA dioxygenase family)
MSGFELTLAQIEQFDEQGYVIVPGLLDSEEVELLKNISRADRELKQDVASRADGEGGAVDLVVRNDVEPETIYGAIVASESLVSAMEAVLGDEVYHYHHKMILKEPRVGGAWAWHQDYGYWYNNGCLWPAMGSCLIAVDRATRENGCLQVIAGSHQLGRIDHGPVGDQTGADPERTKAVLERLPLEYVELEPGSAVIFHSNLLHRSDQNKSENPRWAFICCYNTKTNDPYKDGRHPHYSPLERRPDAAIAAVGRAQWEAMQQPLGQSDDA